ncbi:MAG: cobamide remodeling phosphodiesterase CbiR [Desulfobacteraceae bacterium]
MATAQKRQYPFRLATTSFIYPAGYASNVRQLASLVDEIELLFFEHRHLPPKSEIVELADLAEEHCITYNVHLPMDVDMAGGTAEIRRRSIDAVARAIDLVTPLHPTTHTLHLTFNGSDPSTQAVHRWQDLALASVSGLLELCGRPARSISIETLDYDPRWFKPVVEGLDLAVCVDVGHVILYGFDLEQVFALYADRTTMLHLHGVANGKDHLALSQLDPFHRGIVAAFLQAFQGSASIEVFSRDRLDASLDNLPNLMNP